MTFKLYAERDAMALDEAGGYYCKHVSAMTGEGLHSKGDIAAELGFRDMRIDQLLKECDALAAESAGLKANLMFWDADNPESPYDSPEEIASEYGLNYNEELVVQVAAKLPNRTYRVCESWDIGGKMELVEGSEVQTPTTDSFIAEMQAQGVERFISRIEWIIRKECNTDATERILAELSEFAAEVYKEGNHDA